MVGGRKRDTKQLYSFCIIFRGLYSKFSFGEVYHWIYGRKFSFTVPHIDIGSSHDTMCTIWASSQENLFSGFLTKLYPKQPAQLQRLAENRNFLCNK